jgi:ribosomal protein S15P/S13E
MSSTPKQPGLDGRGREKSGQIDHKHPTTKIKHLREHYGAHFAPDWDGERTLGELLKETKFESLTQYVKHHGHHSESQTESI